MIFFSFAQAQEENSYSAENFSSYLRSGSDYGLGIRTLGLFDPSRMTFSHSISSSYVTSGGNGVMSNLFMETIGYRISNPLNLTLNLGYFQQPYSSYQQTDIFNSGAFVGSAALTWRPRDNMFLHLEVGNLPSYGTYGNYPYGHFMPRYTPFDSYRNDNKPGSTGLYEEE